MKYISQSPKQIRYHPAIIRFCLGLYAKSPAAYEHLRLSEEDEISKMDWGALFCLFKGHCEIIEILFSQN